MAPTCEKKCGGKHIISCRDCGQNVIGWVKVAGFDAADEGAAIHPAMASPLRTGTIDGEFNILSRCLVTPEI